MHRILVFEQDPDLLRLLRARLVDPRIDVVAGPPAPASADDIVVTRGAEGTAEWVGPSRLVMIELPGMVLEHKWRLAYLHAVDCVVAPLLYPIVKITPEQARAHGEAFPLLLSEPIRYLGERDGARHYAVRDRLTGAVEHLVEGAAGSDAIESSRRALGARPSGGARRWRQEIAGDRCFVVGGEPPAPMSLRIAA